MAPCFDIESSSGFLTQLIDSQMPNVSYLRITNICLILAAMLTIVVTQAVAQNGTLKTLARVTAGGYGAYPESRPKHRPVEIAERVKHTKADIDDLWKSAQILHPGLTTRAELSTAYNKFEASMQQAADELKTTEPLKSSWAEDLIALYTRPHHRWPAVSHSLDDALSARATLVKFTSEKSVAGVEHKLFRFAAIEDKSRYYRSPDLRPHF